MQKNTTVSNLEFPSLKKMLTLIVRKDQGPVFPIEFKLIFSLYFVEKGVLERSGTFDKLASLVTLKGCTVIGLEGRRNGHDLLVVIDGQNLVYMRILCLCNLNPAGLLFKWSVHPVISLQTSF